MGLIETFKKLIEEGLRKYHLKQIGEYRLYYLKKKTSFQSHGVYARKKGGKLMYLTADPDKVLEKLQEKIKQAEAEE